MSKPTRPPPPPAPHRWGLKQPAGRPQMAKPPPAYRPQPAPKVLQPKAAAPQLPNHSRPAPVAPPVYRPQAAPKVLQPKLNAAQRLNAGPSRRPPVAPPVYRPHGTESVQPKLASAARVARPTAGPKQARGLGKDVKVSAQGAPVTPGARAGVIQRRIPHNATDWFPDAAALTNPVGEADQAHAERLVNQYLRVFPVADWTRTLEQEIARVSPFISNAEANALTHSFQDIWLRNINGMSRATVIARIDALVALVNAADDRIALAGGEVAHQNFRNTYGGTAAELNEALARAGSAVNLQANLDAAYQELWTDRPNRRVTQNRLLRQVLKVMRDRAVGPRVRGWGHRAGAPVVIFWVDGVVGYWDFAEVHAHINMPGGAQTQAVATDGTGHYVAHRSVVAERYVNAVNIRVPYTGAARQNLPVNDPVAVLCLNNFGYDPARWDQAQGTLADF